MLQKPALLVPAHDSEKTCHTLSDNPGGKRQLFQVGQSEIGAGQGAIRPFARYLDHTPHFFLTINDRSCHQFLDHMAAAGGLCAYDLKHAQVLNAHEIVEQLWEPRVRGACRHCRTGQRYGAGVLELERTEKFQILAVNLQDCDFVVTHAENSGKFRGDFIRRAILPFHDLLKHLPVRECWRSSEFLWPDFYFRGSSAHASSFTLVRWIFCGILVAESTCFLMPSNWAGVAVRNSTPMAETVRVAYHASYPHRFWAVEEAKLQHHFLAGAKRRRDSQAHSTLTHIVAP